MLSAFIAFFGFIVLGMPSGVMGIAWSPYIVDTFQLSLGDIGLPNLVGIVGVLLITLNSGRLIARLHMGGYLALGMLLLGIAMLGYAAAPTWLVLVGFSFFSGMGSGSFDAGLNTYAAAFRSERFMNWLHACFGLGAAIGPLIMTALLVRDLSWRWGYVLLGGMALSLSLIFFLTRHSWMLSHKPESASALDKSHALSETLRLPVVWLNFGLFIMYTSLEISAGLWSFSLLTSRGIAPEAAGVWVSLFWASLTLGRFLFGLFVNRFTTAFLLRACIIGVIIGVIGLGFPLGEMLNLAGLLLFGFCLAPIYPLMMSVTPQRIGREHASNAIGLQTGGAYLGGVIFPAAIGLAAAQLGLEIIGPILLLCSVLMFIINELIFRAHVVVPVVVIGD